MRTDDLIARLADHVAPVPRPTRTLVQGLAVGALVALAFTAVVLGFRRDLPRAIAEWQYWAKFAYPLAFAAAGFWTVERLSRPGARAGTQGVITALPFALIALAALGQWMATPVPQQHVMLFGGSYLVCPWLIMIVSLPVFVGVLWSLKQLAPTRPMLAGAAAGLFSGAAGAWIYAMHCNESSLVFVAIWYSLGIALMGVLGALVGRWALRW